MAALLERSAPSRALNDGLGRSRRSWAIRKSSVSSGSPEGRGARGSASMPSSASASRSIRASSLMDVPHASPQALERAELKLLHRALRAPERLGDLPKALLLDEARDDDALLIAGQTADEVGEHRSVVGVGRSSVVGRLRQRLPAFPRPALPAIGDGIARDLQKPGRERYAAPLEAVEVSQRLVEDLGGHILSLAATARTAGRERVNAVEISLVQLGETARVRLRGLDRQPLVVTRRDRRRR